MAEQLKKMFFTRESIGQLAGLLQKAYPEFDADTFQSSIYDDTWDNLELKEKMRHTTLCLGKTLPQSYPEAIAILKKIAPEVKGFEAMTLPDFVEVYGQEEFERSMDALGEFTRYSSAEFAIRPFLDNVPEKTMKYMEKWATHDEWLVRRLASEGCRPRLPWAMALAKFKKDPSPILPILETLKNDPSEDVRRSVANNLNDISKDNPDIALEIFEKWYGQKKEIDRIVKHACRTLLKAGNKRAMILFGYCDPANISIENLKLTDPSPAIGDKVVFTFDMNIADKKESSVRLEYAVDYLKANGKHSKKVFKITENMYQPGIHSFKRSQSFQNMSTRVHYPGQHRIAIIINGEEKAKISFDLRD